MSGHIQRRAGRNWVARYRTPDGRERSKSFRRKVDAERFLAQVEIDKARGKWVDPRLGRISLGEWTEEYLTTVTDLRPSTRARDESYIRTHVLPRFGTTPLSAIDHMAVRCLGGGAVYPAGTQHREQGPPAARQDPPERWRPG